MQGQSRKDEDQGGPAEAGRGVWGQELSASAEHQAYHGLQQVRRQMKNETVKRNEEDRKN